MTEVRIERMSATAADWPEPDQVPAMLQHISADRLAQALRQSPLPKGEWCVRRLDVAVHLDPDRPLSALETDWADRIVTALRLSLRDGSQDVVRYLRPEQAVDDLLLGLSTARYEHAWAWRQVGLLEPGDPEPQVDPGSVFLLVLERLLHGRVAALVRLVRSAGPAAVHRLLGSAGWVRAAALVAAEAGAVWAPTDPARTEAAPTDQAPTDDALRDPVPSTTAADGATSTPAGRVEALAAAILASGSLAPSLHGAGLRVDGHTLQAWAVLVIGAADPSLLRAAPRRFRLLLAAVGERLRPQAEPGLGAAQRRQWSAGTPGATPGSAGRLGRTGESGRGVGTEPASTIAPVTTTRRPPAPAPDAGPGTTDRPRPTPTSSWGGLLFLLNSAAAAGLPDLLDEPPFDAHPASWVLHRLGRALVPVDPDDPALTAFSGSTSGWAEGRAKKAERRAIAVGASRWISATAKLLRPSRADGDEPSDAELVRRLARRTATIELEPGWVEVGLRLDEVDLDVRRAGLDIDPGWVWWLGHVVRFRYE